MTEVSSSYKFLYKVLNQKEIDDTIVCGYPWRFTVNYLVFDDQTGENIPSIASYFALEYDAHTDVEKKWRYEHNESFILLEDIWLDGIVECSNSPLKTSLKKTNKNIN
jgi:tRNA A37 threonylcarbamoyltransferase TsaD